MHTIAIKDHYAEVLTTLGELQPSVDMALQRYIIEQISDKIAGFREKDRAFQGKYGCDYPTFMQRIREEEAFVLHLEADITPMWEHDQAEWEFYYEGIEDWMQQLQSVLLLS